MLYIEITLCEVYLQKVELLLRKSSITTISRSELIKFIKSYCIFAQRSSRQHTADGKEKS